MPVLCVCAKHMTPPQNFKAMTQIPKKLLHPSHSAFRSYKRLSGQSKGTKLTWIPAQRAQQPGSLDCGYYVMRFMYDIIMNHGNSQDLTKEEHCLIHRRRLML
ncbi:uncharacterized protein [Spinacia oleracea]|uniref:Ubiquitin-like protease family profile domain-containing protein n=1 Tax=Spinacia oleracea TaxID=3562 RepID=A0ABM3RNV7_SPIOL|nr:uncharacterized protein LOC130471273 [Spinacia oleracea]